LKKLGETERESEKLKTNTNYGTAQTNLKTGGKKKLWMPE